MPNKIKWNGMEGIVLCSECGGGYSYIGAVVMEVGPLWGLHG